VDEYAYRSKLERTARAQAVAVERVAVTLEADGRRGKAEARLAFNDDAFMEVHQALTSDGGVLVPRAYAYCVVERGVMRVRFDLDPRHDPAAHLHREGIEKREPFRAVSLP